MRIEITNEDIMDKLIKIEQLVELAVPPETMAIKRRVEFEMAKNLEELKRKDKKDKE